MNGRQLLGLALLGGIGVYIFSRSRAATVYAMGPDGGYYPVPAGQDGSGARFVGGGATPGAAAAYLGPAGGGAPLSMLQPYQGEYDAPGFGSTAGRVGLAAGTTVGTGVATAALGPGTVAGALSMGALAVPIVGAGAALLTWAVVQKGLFRGGEEGVQVNPARDQFILQFGDTSWNANTSGWLKLSRILAEISAFETGGADNQVYERSLMRPLLAADSMDKFVPKTREIRELLARYGVDIAAF